jgi:trigger factor
MAVTVETLDKLERKITLTLPVNVIQNEVDSRLKKLARTVKMDGFRPGKVPMNVVAQRYGYSVHYEVMNDKVGEAFSPPPTKPSCAWPASPRSPRRKQSPEGELAFDAVFEVYPEVKIGELAGAEVEKLSAEVSDAAIDKTLDILRKQRRTFAQRAQDAVPRRTATVSRSTSKARSTASPSRAARPRTSSSWSAKARCSRNSRTPCAA